MTNLLIGKKIVTLHSRVYLIKKNEKLWKDKERLGKKEEQLRKEKEQNMELLLLKEREKQSNYTNNTSNNSFSDKHTKYLTWW